MNKQKIVEFEKAYARIIAHIMGDGNLTEKYIRYNNKNHTLLEQFKKDIILVFRKTHFTEGKVNSGTPFVNVSSKAIVADLRKHHPTYKSGEINVPPFIRKSNLNIKAEFLKAYYDDEGCASLRSFRGKEWKRSISLGSKSRTMLENIYTFFINDFDIKPNKLIAYSYKGFIWYILTITGKENIEQFSKKIGFSHPDKIQKLDRILQSYIRK